MFHPKRRIQHGGFAILELPIALVALAVLGILAAFVFSLFTTPAPWYAWVAVAATLPGVVVAYVIVAVGIHAGAESIRKRRRERIRQAYLRRREADTATDLKSEESNF